MMFQGLSFGLFTATITYYVNDAGLEVSIGYDLFEAETWYGETYWAGTASMLYISIQS